MTKRTIKRPQKFVKPDYWDSAPAPNAEKTASETKTDSDSLSPTRYGDWVKNGIAIDF